MTDKKSIPTGEFTDIEMSLINNLRAHVAGALKAYHPVEQHRLLLGVASELVDEAADLVAISRPGMRVVELGLLAERITHVALGIEPPQTETLPNPSD